MNKTKSGNHKKKNMNKIMCSPNCWELLAKNIIMEMWSENTKSVGNDTVYEKFIYSTVLAV